MSTPTFGMNPFSVNFFREAARPLLLQKGFAAAESAAAALRGVPPAITIKGFVHRRPVECPSLPVTSEALPAFALPSPAGDNALSRNVQGLLARTEYRRCASDEDFAAIGGLRYRSYTSSGLALPTGAGEILDELDRAPNCHVFGVYVDGRLAATVRIHHVTADCPLSPAMSAFPDVLEPRLARGETFIDPSRFAADLDLASRHRGLPYAALRIPAMASEHFGTTACLSMVVDRHSGFYARIFRSAQIGAPRSYPGITSLTRLMAAHCDDSIREHVYIRYPFFRSTEEERRSLFEVLRPRGTKD